MTRLHGRCLAGAVSALLCCAAALAIGPSGAALAVTGRMDSGAGVASHPSVAWHQPRGQSRRTGRRGLGPGLGQCHDPGLAGVERPADRGAVRHLAFPGSHRTVAGREGRADVRRRRQRHRAAAAASPAAIISRPARARRNAVPALCLARWQDTEPGGDDGGVRVRRGPGACAARDRPGRRGFRPRRAGSASGHRHASARDGQRPDHVGSGDVAV